jgi:hypothetical protein
MALSLHSTVQLSQKLQIKTNNYLAMQNAAVKKKYSSTLKSKEKTVEERKLSRESKKYHPRTPCNGKNSKLNLFPLTNNQATIEEKKLLTKTLTSLIHSIYKNEAYVKKTLRDRSYSLKDLVWQIQLGLYKHKSLAKVPFKDAKQREFFLNLYKGTYKSTKKTKALFNYISVIDTNNSPPLVFPSMSLQLLEAFFNKEVVKKITKQETSLYYQGKATARLSKEELEKILGENNFIIHKKLLRYQLFPKGKEQAILQNSKDGLTILGPLN